MRATSKLKKHSTKYKLATKELKEALDYLKVEFKRWKDL